MNGFSKDYKPKNTYSDSYSDTRRNNKIFLIIVSCLMTVLVIAGIAALAKSSKAKKAGKAAQGSNSAIAEITQPTTEEDTTGYPTEFPDGVTVTDISQVRETKEKVNVRKGPGKDFELLGELGKDEVVTVTGRCSNGWVRVVYNEKAGYCSEKFLKDEEVTDPAPETTTSTETTTAPTNETTTSAEVTTPENKNIDSKSPYYITVNRVQNLVIVYSKDDQGNYSKPVKAMVCSVGLNGKTELGTFKIGAQDGKPARSRWRQLTGGVYGQYISRFNGSILFHSVPYYSQNPGDLEYNEYNKLGQAASAGCVRLCVADAKWIYENCPDGTVVRVYDGNGAEPLAKPTPKTIDTSDTAKRGWDPTDPDPNNPWKSN